jgi:hypothetical protein
MASIWEQLAERVGYGLGALIYGPGWLVERRARRVARDALLGWCDGLATTKLVAPRGWLKRTVSLPTQVGEPITIEVDLDLAYRRATVVAVVQALPSYAAARVSRALGLIRDVRMRLGKPLAMSANVRVDSETLDADAGQALLETVANGPLARLEAFDLDIRSEQIELRIVAPSAMEEWSSVGAGLVAIVTWLAKRWPSSYRS